MGERFVRNEEVASSILVRSTSCRTIVVVQSHLFKVGQNDSFNKAAFVVAFFVAFKCRLAGNENVGLMT